MPITENDHQSSDLLRVTQQTIQELRELCQQGKGTFVEADPSLEEEALDDYPEMHRVTLTDNRQTVELIIHPDGTVKIIHQKIDENKFTCDFTQRFEDEGQVWESVSLTLTDMEAIPSLQAYQIEHVSGFISEEDDYDEFHFELAFQFKDKFVIRWKGSIDRSNQGEKLSRSYQLPGDDRMIYSLDTPTMMGKWERDKKTEIDEIRKRFQLFDLQLVSDNGKGLLQIKTDESIITIRIGRPKEASIKGMIRSFQREPDSEDPEEFSVPPVPLVPFFIEEKKR